MKKIILLTAFILLAMPFLVKADIIEPNSHSVARCAKIVNLDQFPNLKLFGVYTEVTGGQNEQEYQIEQNKCLYKGYKFNTLDIFWQADNGPRKKVDFAIDTYGGQVPDSNNLIAETIDYKISWQGGDNPVVLKEAGRLERFKDGTASQIYLNSDATGIGWSNIIKTGKYFILSLVVTILIELSLLFWLIRKKYKINSQDLSRRKIIITGIVASGLTLALIWYIWPLLVTIITMGFDQFRSVHYDLFYNLGEILVIFIEALIYWLIFRIKYRSALFISFVCNLASYLIGIIIFLLI